jgi:hypothetical protein
LATKSSEQLNRSSYYMTADTSLKTPPLPCHERPLIVSQVFKVDLEDHLVIHVDDCGPTGHARSVLTAKHDRPSLATNMQSKPVETVWSRSRALPKLRETPDRAVVT